MPNRFSRVLVRILPALATLLLPMVVSASARADGFHFSQSTYTVSESVGSATITIQRSDDLDQEAQIRYITMGVPIGTAVSPWDFSAQKGMLDFPAGVTSESFQIPIVDHGVDASPKTIQLSMFGAASWPLPIGMGDPAVATVKILYDDPVPPRDPSNPLELQAHSASGNPLAGATFFVDHENEPSQAARSFPALSVIADQPGTARFGGFSGPNVGLAVSKYLTRAAYEEPGTIPLLATYRIQDSHCGHYTPPPSVVASYHRFIDQFASGVGSYRAVLFLEMDSLITTPCLTSRGLAIRLAELHYAVDTLTRDCPHLVIYMDAGAADALPARLAARLLRRAGVSEAQGFFLNSTHFDWTSREIAYGQQVSRLTGGKHFVVNTGENGQGPLVPRDRVHQGNEVLCNPPGRGLGPKPTTDPGYPNVDAFAWTTNPGESGGRCGAGAPSTGSYWPLYALGLVSHANFSVR